MPVWTIIVIAVVVVAILLMAVLLLPGMREKARIKRRERELGQRREQAVTEHREVAESRARRADEAEHRARIAEQEARRERAESQLREEKAALHERGMADDELISDDERARFAGTSAVAGEPERAEEFQEGPGAEEREDLGEGPAWVAGACLGRRGPLGSPGPAWVAA